MTDSTNVVFDDSDLDYVPSVDTGYPDQLAAEDTVENMALCGARDFPEHLWIDPADWKDKARENDRLGTWPDDYRNRFTNQSPTHECTCHSLLQNFEIAWNRQRQSKESAVWMSALSVYAEANPRQRGGASMQGTLRIALDRGILPEFNGPKGLGTQRELFNATLNNTSGSDPERGGPWVPVSRFPNNWKQTARHFRPDEVINPDNWEQMVCLVLNGVAVSLGRKGHAIPHTKIVWRDRKLYASYPDSYDVVRYDSVSNIKAGVGGSYGIVTTTTPDNWDRPAGDDMKAAI